MTRFNCNSCSLAETCIGPIAPDEPSDPKFVVCGDRPGSVEDAVGTHFVGLAGEILNDAFRLAEIPSYYAVKLNVTLCAPPNARDSTNKECEACVRTNISRFVEKYKNLPWILVGAKAIKYVGEVSGGVRDNVGRQWETKSGLRCFGAPNPTAIARGMYRTNQLARVLKQMLGKMQSVDLVEPTDATLAVDTETTGLDFYRNAEPFIATSCDGKVAKLYTLTDLRDRAELQADVDRADRVVMANALFDCGQLAKVGVNVPLSKVFDVQWGAALHDTGNCPYRLERLGDFYFKNGGKHKRKLDEHVKKLLKDNGAKSLHEGFKTISMDVLRDYALLDANLTYAISRHPTIIRVVAEYPEFVSREQRLLKTTQNIEQYGILVDLSRIATAITHMEARRDYTLVQLRQHPDIRVELPEFNPSSHVQTAKVMELLGLSSPERTKTGNPSYGKIVLALMGHPIAQLILDYRSYRLLAGGALQSIPNAVAKDGRIHPSFHSTGTESGRFTCKTRAETEDEKVNLHGIPKDRMVRRIFVAPEDKVIVSMDMSQIENRGMAHFSECKKLIDGYTEDPNTDFYSLIASEIYGRKISKANPEDYKIRQEVKVVVLAKGYGAGAKKIAKIIRRSIEYTLEFLASYDASLPEIQNFFLKIRDEITRTGRVVVEDWACQIDPRVSYQGVNRVIQGVCAVHFKRLLNEIDAMIAGYEDIHMVMHVHDEIVFEIAKEKLNFWIPKLKHVMENGWGWAVPVVVNTSVGNDWGDMKDYTYA